MSFDEITNENVGKFIAALTRPVSKSQKPISPKTMRNILVPSRAVWQSACAKYKWNLPDPFHNLKRFYNKPAKRINRRENGGQMFSDVWRFEEAMAIIKHMHPHYRNVTKLMFLTGLSASEIAGLETGDIQGDLLVLNTFIVDNREKNEGKSPYRSRSIPITSAIRVCLDEALATMTGKKLFMTITGLTFRNWTYRGCYWKPAIKRAGLRYIKPYSTRHTFAAWALAIGMNPNQLVPLMGHGSKQMVYEIYGNYTAGLAQDREKILSFMGHDFLNA